MLLGLSIFIRCHTYCSKQLAQMAGLQRMSVEYPFKLV